ncbi:MAG: hypothetical protein MUF60_08515 [Vicinamibacterales bacterium]|nr:hypothetical protein [Vicinamibacterales bacterium]
MSRPSARRRVRAALALLTVVVAAACGKKGPPLPPLQRVPAEIKDVAARRIGDEAYVTFTVPSTNVAGDTPADVVRVDVYAFTTDAAPDAFDPMTAGTVVASIPVRRPLPPPEPDQPPPPPLPGVDQGAAVTVRETLGPAQRTPVSLPAADARGGAATARTPPGKPLGGSPLLRHYVAVPVSARGRAGAHTRRAAVPLETASGAPGAPTLTYDAAAVSVAWTPPADARRAAQAAEGVLPSKPLVPAPPPTTYNVYRVDPGGAPPGPAAPGQVTPPVPLNAEPLAGPPFADPGVAVGEERCYVVRAVDTVAGLPLIGPASPVGCVTPRDTFPPAAPRSLAAVAGPGAISLIWEPSEEADLAGYVVLRGEAPGAELRAITAEPIRETTYRDTTVQPGVRYVYAVVAVDRATPQNVSAQSNRVEETARQ